MAYRSMGRATTGEEVRATNGRVGEALLLG